ncbi:MAG: RecX family transcriptional regulator [Nitrospirae bacterium]|nr:RecX family transcriptional regulator [Nitrospirota bacterium]
MADEIKRAKDAAYKFLSYRPRSKKEVADRLKKKGFSDEVIKGAVKSLENYNYINDSDFAFNLAEDKIRKKPTGPALLRSELIKKGIPKDIVDKTIKEIYNKYGERSLAINALNSRTKIISGLREADKKRRLYNYLIQRGFSYDIANEILGEMEIET